MCYVAVPEGAEAVLAAKFAVMRSLLGERQWRVYLGSEARARGHGGIAAVARAAGCSESTVAAGVAEIEAGGLEALPPGGGRKKAEEAQPGLKQALAGLLEAVTRGDPMVHVTWCSLSLREIGREMAARGFRCGRDALARMMHQDGYSLQGMSRTAEGKQHPDRDAQFRHIDAMITGFRAAGDPVVSVDGKKKEQLGPYWRAGRSWRGKGDPVKVRDHDFPDEQLGKITPYGVYDIAANRGFVSVGTSRDTAAFAVSALRLWEQQEGSLRYRGAKRLLVTCDAGGSNSYTSRLWKDQLAVLAQETGLEIHVGPPPPGTSKWNKIEPRLFCHITRTWRARPLMTAQAAVAGIAATTTYQGLKVTAVLDGNEYPKGTQISDERMDYLEQRILDRQDTRGEWNYAVLPAPRPAPQPQPPPPGPDLDTLAHPAITGISRAEFSDLAASLEIPYAAAREQRLHLARGGPRRTRPKGPAAPGKLSLPARPPPRPAPAPGPRRAPPYPAQGPCRPGQAQPARLPARRHLPLPARHDLPGHRRPARRRSLHHQRHHPAHRRPARPARHRHHPRPAPYPHPRRPAPPRRSRRNHHHHPRTRCRNRRYARTAGDRRPRHAQVKNRRGLCNGSYPR